MTRDQQTREHMIRSYLAAMESGDLDGVLDCFRDDAIIVSPVYGEEAPRKFYGTLFADTLSVSIDLHAIYAATGDPNHWIAHFGYQWERKTAGKINTNLIDLFEFSDIDDRIERLRIVFDAAPVS